MMEQMADQNQQSDMKTASHAIGLALGAGGARGIAHVHVLRAIDALGVRPAAIAGTSIGGIMGACYAAGMSGEEIHDFLLDRFGDHKAVAASIWALRAQNMADMIGNGRLRVGELDLERILARLLPESLPERIEQLEIDMQIVATRYYRHDDAIFTEGPLLPALAATAAMPAIFHPVVVNGVVHIDGGMTNPVPIDLLQDKARFIIAVDVSGGPEGEEGVIPTKVDVLYAASQLMQRTILREKIRNCHCDLLFAPKVGAWRVLDFMRTDEVIRATEPLFEEAKTVIGNALDGAPANARSVR